MNFKIRAIRQHAQITSSKSELKNTITHKGLQCLMMDRLIAVARPTLRPRGVLWTSSDGDDGRILWVLNFRFRDLWAGKLGKYVLGWLDLRRDFWEVFKTI